MFTPAFLHLNILQPQVRKHQMGMSYLGLGGGSLGLKGAKHRGGERIETRGRATPMCVGGFLFALSQGWPSTRPQQGLLLERVGAVCEGGGGGAVQRAQSPKGDRPGNAD